ncbi:type I phosphomannose isomerase catalytic subunit [Bacillus canaveralius]|uniref:type I phosphomannose isomerase catalytic subunit n=1 Tax=Bacillus canaveralius TaxID=1403243 RepID=UPI000F79B2EE|nr:type I phosphomannose isomerase catalytic subunit [Bacillus canaveralius]RSK47436.1 mannose-6-phosphate isomerase [Bacillus canaveralius]
MYPLKFNTIYIHKPWGGRNLEKYKPGLPEGIIGETWEVSCHPQDTSIITNGKLEGMKLTELIDKEGSTLVGSEISTEWFPLMLRYVSAQDKLSIQVHPDDEFARKQNEPMGKTEAWYILDAKEDAFLYAGVLEGDTDSLKKAAIEGTIEQNLKKLYVKKGDVILIPSGLIHAICEGLTLIELCNNSNTTYRIYDYNRGRGLDLEEGFQVADIKKQGLITEGLQKKKTGYKKSYLCLDKNFSWELYDVDQSFTEESDPERFYLFTCIEGAGKIHYENGIESISNGESILIPATLGQYTFEGKMKVLKSYVPDLERVEKEILQEIEIGA